MPITEVKFNFVSVLALVNEDDEVLIGKRPTSKIFPGYWEFPGGKIQENETPEQAIIREIEEEIGIDINSSCLAPLSFSTYNSKSLNLILLLFIARSWKGIENANFHTELLWVKINKLRDFKMPPANNYLIATLQDLVI